MKYKYLIQKLSGPPVALFVLVFSGCNTIVPEPPVPGPMVEESYTAISHAGRLQIAVDAYAVDAADRYLARSIEKQVEGRLNRQGLQVIPEGGDLSVDIAVSSDVFDRSGNYIRMEGTADTTVKRNYDRSTVDSQSIAVRASRRLGEAAARDALVTELSRKTADWTVASLGDRSLQISANDITVSVSIFRNAADYSRKFIREVSRVDGVASVTLIPEDSRRKNLTFRVVYFKNKIPEGILRRIARIDGLNIRL